MRIAIDAMGGDNAPSEIVKGAVQAAQELPDEIILVGPEGTLRSMVDAYSKRYRTENIRIVNASEVISQEKSGWGWEHATESRACNILGQGDGGPD